jgi:hypothetical protein
MTAGQYYRVMALLRDGARLDETENLPLWLPRNPHDRLAMYARKCVNLLADFELADEEMRCKISDDDQGC